MIKKLSIILIFLAIFATGAMAVPTVTINQLPGHPYGPPSPTFEGVASDPIYNITIARYTWDTNYPGGPWYACYPLDGEYNEPTEQWDTRSKMYGNFTEGQHTIYVRAWNSQNQTGENSYTFQVDATAPGNWNGFYTIRNDGTSALETEWTNDSTPVMKVQVRDTLSGLRISPNTAYYQAYNPDTGWGPWKAATCSGSNGTTVYQWITATAEAGDFKANSDLNKVRFRIEDMAGNTGYSHSTGQGYTVKIDTNPPTINIGKWYETSDYLYADPNYIPPYAKIWFGLPTSLQYATLSGEASDTGGSNLWQAYFEAEPSLGNLGPLTVSLSGSTAPWSRTDYRFLNTYTDASSPATVTIYDNAHNSVFAIYPYQKDQTSPNAFDLSSPQDQWFKVNPITFQWNTTTDSGSGMWKYELWVDGIYRDYVDHPNSSINWSVPLGWHNWYMFAVDNVNNKRNSNQTNWNVGFDNIAPSVTVTKPNGGEVWTEGGTQEITWTATDAHSGIKPNSIDIYLCWWEQNSITDEAQNWHWEPIPELQNLANDGSEMWTNVRRNFPNNPGFGQYYRIGVRAEDNATNTGQDMSDANFSIIQPDTQAPTQITNLQICHIANTNVMAIWTAPSDNVGVVEYQLQYRPIDIINWTDVTGEPTPETAGRWQGMYVNLPGGDTYLFRIRSRDAAMNWSAWSNIPLADTVYAYRVEHYEDQLTGHPNINRWAGGSGTTFVMQNLNTPPNTDVAEGIQSGRLNYSSNSQWGGQGGTLPSTINISAYNGVSFKIKGDGSANKIKVRLLTDDNNYFTSKTEISLASTTWETKAISYTNFESTGSPSWSNITKYYFMITTQPTGTGSFYTDSLTAANLQALFPALDLTAYLQGYYLGGGNTRLATVEVQLRTIRDDPSSVVATYEGIALDASGHAAPLLLTGVSSGNYYVVLRHERISNNLRGINHLSIVSNNAVTFTQGQTRIIQFIDPLAPNWVEPKGYPDSMWSETDGKKSLRGGDASGDGAVSVVDYSIWYQQNGTSGPEADFDGNDAVNVLDYGIWYQNNGQSSYVVD